jgi:hypothetical protein
MYKNYFIGLSFVLVNLLYFGFLGPWLVSSRSDIGVWVGFLFLPCAYIPYVMWLVNYIIKKGEEYRKAKRIKEEKEEEEYNKTWKSYTTTTNKFNR